MKLSEVISKNDPKTKIENALNRYKIKNFSINDDLTVDVDGTVTFNRKSFTKLPVKFGHITESFIILDCPNLISLNGVPHTVDKDFSIMNCNSVISLENSPTKVGSDYRVINVKIRNLEHSPKIISGNCYINYCNHITSLKGCPEYVGEHFSLFECKNLLSLDYLPKKIGGLINLFYCKRVTNILKIFDIKGLNQLVHHNPKIQKIVCTYLKTNDLLGCQDELIEAGFEEYAEVE